MIASIQNKRHRVIRASRIVWVAREMKYRVHLSARIILIADQADRKSAHRSDGKAEKWRNAGVSFQMRCLSFGSECRMSLC